VSSCHHEFSRRLPHTSPVLQGHTFTDEDHRSTATKAAATPSPMTCHSGELCSPSPCSTRPHAMLKPVVKIARSSSHHRAGSESIALGAHTRGDHALPARPRRRLGPIWPLCQVEPPLPWAGSGPVTVHPLFNFFSKLKSSRNSYNLQFTVDETKLIKTSK
jgi:hypothetical protein